MIGTGPNGVFTVDDLRGALVGQPGDSTVICTDVGGEGDPQRVVLATDSVLNDHGRILFYLVTARLPE